MYPTPSMPFGNPQVGMMRDPTMRNAGRAGQRISNLGSLRGRRSGGFASPMGPLMQQLVAGQMRSLPGSMGQNQASLLTQLAFRR